MYNLLRTNLTFGNRLKKREEIQSFRHSRVVPSSESPQEVQYNQVSNAILITEVDEEGYEKPIAIAFVQSRAEIKVCYLFHLAELE